MTEHSDLRNYYRILGISPGASTEEVKRAYRRLAKELHPDRHSNDPAATAKFQALNEAHAVLSDPEARARYDAACIAR
jgi:molecular chaperone DnaJ